MSNPITIDERKAMRRRAWWTVANFARYTGVSHWQAKSALVRFNAELGGMLLRPSTGANRKYGFYWALLARHAPDAFIDDPLETQRRLDDVEDKVDGVHQAQRMLASQTGMNTREIARLKRDKKVA